MVQAWAPRRELDLPDWMQRRRSCELSLHGLSTNNTAAEMDQDSANVPTHDLGHAAEALANWLSALRQREGVTVRELARLVDLPASSVAAYMSGMSIPNTQDRLDRVLRGLNASDDESEFAAACYWDHRIGMSPRQPPPIAERATTRATREATSVDGETSSETS
jgi:transcriptional regulator with XRE-family HTH domain